MAPFYQSATIVALALLIFLLSATGSKIVGSGLEYMYSAPVQIVSSISEHIPTIQWRTHIYCL